MSFPSLLDPATQSSAFTDTSKVRPTTTSPKTPIMGSTNTPNLSSPDTPQQPETPYANLQTPAGSIGTTTSRRDIDQNSLDEGVIYGESSIEGRIGLGYGDVKKGKISDIERTDIDLRETGEVKMSIPRKRSFSEISEPEIRGLEFPDVEALRRMLERVGEIEGDQEGGNLRFQKDEMATMVRSLVTPALTQLPFLHSQIAAQHATIHTMQQQTRLTEQLMALERDRHSAERTSWYAETNALINARESELVAGSKGKKVLDLDVGYHQELEAANKRLEMDNRLMAPRLADTQRQIERLVIELCFLRSHVIMLTQPLYEASGQQSTTRHRTGGATRSPVRTSKSNYTTMGDARTEHLLLAARTVRKRQSRGTLVGRLTLDELKRGGVIGPDGGLGYSEGYGDGDVEAEDDEEDESEVEDEKPVYGNVGQDRRPSQAAKGKSKATPQLSSQAVALTPLLPRAKRSSKRALPTPTHPVTPSRTRTQPPATTPGGSNFNDLLRAAELATRPGTPTPDPSRGLNVPMSVTSAARSTTRNRDDPAGDDLGDLGSPTKRQRRGTAPGLMSFSAGGRKIRGMEVTEEENVMKGLDETGENEERDRFTGNPSSGTAIAGSQHNHQEDASALDLLAQASSLDYAQSDERGGPSQSSSNIPTPLSSATRFGGIMESEDKGVVAGNGGGQSPRSSAGESALGPAISLRTTPPSGRPIPSTIEDHQIDPELAALSRPAPAEPAVAFTPKPVSKPANDVFTPSRPSTYNSFTGSSDDPDDTPPSMLDNRISPSPTSRHDLYMPQEPALGAFASPTGAAVPGLGKYVHLTSSMPARRVRSPYLKWTVEEDELLARAVAIHGEKWDLVSKGVPTRSYHQVRQRWLRKTGAFDKKPPQADLDLSGGMMGGGDYPLHGGYDDDGEDTSPTPHSGRTPSGKKRKV